MKNKVLIVTILLSVSAGTYAMHNESSAENREAGEQTFVDAALYNIDDSILQAPQAVQGEFQWPMDIQIRETKRRIQMLHKILQAEESIQKNDQRIQILRATVEKGELILQNQQIQIMQAIAQKEEWIQQNDQQFQILLMRIQAEELRR